ncbi:hypothetical protein MUP77_15535 [Candidatus Bathyarchaeota archaeon]|nr:hypothetical protein [Candidatus Bathyarchaeota archaeon]
MVQIDLNQEWKLACEAIRLELVKARQLNSSVYDLESNSLKIENIRKMPNPRIQEIFRKFQELKSAVESIQQAQESAQREKLKGIGKELLDGLNRPKRPIIEPRQWYQEKGQNTLGQSWANELREASGISVIPKQIPLIPQAEAERETEGEGDRIYMASWLGANDELRRAGLEYFYGNKEKLKSDLAEKFVSQFKGKRFLFEGSNWNASSGLVEGNLGDLLEYNVNNWRLGDSESIDQVVRQLNSGEIPFRIDHSKSVLSWVGTVKSAQRIGNTIKIEADCDDDGVNRVLEKHSHQLGLSLGLESEDLLCGKCHSKTDAKSPCSNCGSHKKDIFSPLVKETSICLEPAWNSARIKSYKKVE